MEDINYSGPTVQSSRGCGTEVKRGCRQAGMGGENDQVLCVTRVSAETTGTVEKTAATWRQRKTTRAEDVEVFDDL